MKKEKFAQVNLKNQMEVSKMQEVKNIPYSKKALLKWSAFRIEKSTSYERYYDLINTPLVDLVKKPGYERFTDRLNWLYNNFSKENYQLVWSELQDYNEKRKVSLIQDNLITRADEKMAEEIKEWKYHFGEIPAWIEKLNDKQRDLLLARARVCYGLEPEEVVLETKQVYTLPRHIIKDYNELGYPVYYSQDELKKVNFVDNCLNNIVGRVKIHSEYLKRLAENAVIRDASWLAKFNNTEFDLREHREVEDTEDHNKMVPITDLQGNDSPYGIEVLLRDFLEPIYEEDEGR